MNDTPFTKEELAQTIDKIPDIKTSTGRVRLHQGWWRVNILNEKAGINPVSKNENVCNTITGGNISSKNFLTKNTVKVLEQVLADRNSKNVGMINLDRLYNNLLSSQPLCFNFFAEFEIDKTLGLQVLKTFWPDVTVLNKVVFEYSPPENYTKDGSAFDVGFDVMFGDKTGFIGLECKYTDTFSFKPSTSPIFYGDVGNKNHEVFYSVYSSCKSSFNCDYFDFVKNKQYNQLFRSQLMAEAMEQNKRFDIVKTGLFCYQNDEVTIASTKEFASMLADGKFKIITYGEFFEAVQRLELSWEQREWTMLLWARYCGLILSENVYNQLLGE
jgi:hypothetical protein